MIRVRTAFSLPASQVFRDYGRLAIWAVGLILFLGIMWWLRIDAGEPIVISQEDAGPLKRSTTTFHPAVDAKRRLLRDVFDYRAPVETDFGSYLRTGSFVRAFQLAYLDSNFRNMRAAVVGLRAHLVPIRSGGEEAGWQISALQHDLVDALDETLLFEAFALERLGARQAALRRYRQYLDLLKQLGPVQLDPAERNIDRRLSAIRIKIFLLERPRQMRHGATPYLDGLISSFLEDVRGRFPYEAYFEQRILPESASFDPSPRRPADAATLADAAAHLDFCLRTFGPNRGSVAAAPGQGPCGAQFYAQSHGGFTLPAAVLEYDRLQNLTNRMAAHEAAGPAAPDQGRESRPAREERFAPAARQAVDAIIRDAAALFLRIRVEAPEGTFLIDDLINDISELVVAGRRGLFSPGQIARGEDAEMVRHVICDLAPVTQRPTYTFDRREELQQRLTSVGRQCR
jgi:hypothetical protein